MFSHDLQVSRGRQTQATVTMSNTPGPPLPQPAGCGRGCGSGSDATGRNGTPVDDVEGEIGSLVDRLAHLLDSHQPTTAAAARSRVTQLGRLSGLAEAATAEAVRTLDRLDGVSADGASSMAEWVKVNTGRSGRDAARVARLATDLADLPATREALASGRITGESADAVVGAARDGRLGPPAQVDADLAEAAVESSPEALRADIRDRQQAVDADAMLHDERRQHAVRDVRLFRRDTGMWRLTGDLPDELGQTLRTAFDAFDHPDPDGAPDDRRRRPGQRLADALAAMAGAVLEGGLAPGTGGITRPHLSVIVHADTVSADLTDPDATDPNAPSAAPAPDDPRWADLPAGDLPWGGKLSPQAVRRICCDAATCRIVMTGQSQVLDVGRATRRWSGPQRRAVNARDGGCRGPNCTRPIGWTQVHHLQWWRRDGVTSVDNGLALCHHCHRLVHDRGWIVHHDLDTSMATWTSPEGVEITTTPSRRSAAPPEPSTAGPAGSEADRGVGEHRDNGTTTKLPPPKTPVPAEHAVAGPSPGADSAPGSPAPTGSVALTGSAESTGSSGSAGRAPTSQQRLDDDHPHTAGGIPRP